MSWRNHGSVSGEQVGRRATTAPRRSICREVGIENAKRPSNQPRWRGGGVGGASRPRGLGPAGGRSARRTSGGAATKATSAGIVTRGNGAAFGIGASSSSHVDRRTGRSLRAFDWARACSCSAHSGHPHLPRFMPHAQWCSGAPPSARIAHGAAGPRSIGAARSRPTASVHQRCSARRSRAPRYSRAPTETKSSGRPQRGQPRPFQALQDSPKDARRKTARAAASEPRRAPSFRAGCEASATRAAAAQGRGRPADGVVLGQPVHVVAVRDVAVEER